MSDQNDPRGSDPEPPATTAATTPRRGRAAPGDAGRAAERKAREAAALRANLLKRKAQQRARRDRDDGSSGGRAG